MVGSSSRRTHINITWHSKNVIIFSIFEKTSLFFFYKCAVEQGDRPTLQLITSQCTQYLFLCVHSIYPFRREMQWHLKQKRMQICGPNGEYHHEKEWSVGYVINIKRRVAVVEDSAFCCCRFTDPLTVENTKGIYKMRPFKSAAVIAPCWGERGSK